MTSTQQTGFEAAREHAIRTLSRTSIRKLEKAGLKVVFEDDLDNLVKLAKECMYQKVLTEIIDKPPEPNHEEK